MLQSILMFESTGELKQMNMEMQLSDRILVLQSKFIGACDGLNSRFISQQLRHYHKERKYRGKVIIESLKEQFSEQIQKTPPLISDINIKIGSLLNAGHNNQPEELIFNWLKIKEDNEPIYKESDKLIEIEVYNSYFPELFLVSHQRVVKHKNDLPYQKERRVQYSIVGVNHLPAELRSQILFKSIASPQ